MTVPTPLCPTGVVRASRAPPGRDAWRHATRSYMPANACLDCAREARTRAPQFWAKFYDAGRCAAYHGWI